MGAHKSQYTNVTDGQTTYNHSSLPRYARYVLRALKWNHEVSVGTVVSGIFLITSSSLILTVK